MSQLRQIQAILKMGAIPGFGPARTRRVLEQLAATDAALEFLPEYEAADLLALGLDDAQAAAFRDAETGDLPDQLLEAGIRLVTMLDNDAPTKLQQPAVSPWFFAYGDVPALGGESLAFSGSRDASPEAIAATTQIAAAAAGRGWAVISGGARGVDAAAHQAALAQGGVTVVVLPQGIIGWRPPEDLDADGLIVLSEFLPHDGWSSYRAMQRNKSIVHLSDWLIIPQAGAKGGTMNAGEYALKVRHPTWVLDSGEDVAGNRILAGKGARVLHWHNDAADLDVLSQPASEPTFGQQRLL